MSSAHPSRTCAASAPVVGVVGGVGAGKSSVIRNVGSLQLFIIDEDRIGHEQLAVASVRDRIHNTFGDQVLDEHGQIDRVRLAAEVFGSSSSQQSKRTSLNEIMHPAIRTEVLRQLETAPHDADAIILDAALLLEAGWADQCDAVIFIDTPIEQRQSRVAKARGWSVEEHGRREASQWSTETKRQYSDFAVDNSGSPEAAARQMESCLKEIIQNVRSGGARINRGYGPQDSTLL